MKLKHVTSRKNADGTDRYYFRRRGQPVVRLPDEPFSPEFMRSYHAQLNWITPAAARYDGTFAWLCDEYMESPEFTTKAENTKNARRRIIMEMLKEPIDPNYPETFAQEMVENFDRHHIVALRDRKAHVPNAANKRLVCLNQIFKVAIDRNLMATNPCQDVTQREKPSQGHRTATDADLEKYENYHRDNPDALFAIHLLKKTGVRVSDLMLLGRQHLDDDVLVFRCKKNKRLCELTLDPATISMLRATPELTFVTTCDGTPYASEKAMSQRVSKWFKQAGVEDITGHSVRKWLATKMADEGCNEFELMAWFGWATPKEARPYVDRVNRRKLAKKAGAKVESVTRYT